MPVEFLGFVAENATEWMRLIHTQGNRKTINHAVDVHLVEACIDQEGMKKTIKETGPGYYIGVNNVIVVFPDQKKKRIHVFPMIVHEGLKQDIVDTCHRKYESIMASQDKYNQEITGIIACQSSQHGTVDTFNCNTVQFSKFSSAPYCGAKRTCQKNELPVDWTMVGEFHSHPLAHGERGQMLMAPPSDADLYQLLVASTKGEHNLSCVCAPEGIYLASCTVRATQLFRHDMKRFFNSVEYPMRDCKQPIDTAVSRDLPYLHLLLTQPKRWFNAMCATGNSDVEGMARAYIRLIQEALDITIDFHPRT